MPTKADIPLASRSIAIGPANHISFIEQAGGGEPVVFLHGIGSAARSWHALFAKLATDPFRLIAWDAPGYGESTALKSEKPVSVQYADALDAFVTALKLPSFHLVGHSLGALIATTYAQHHPERLKSLTLASIAPGHARLTDEEREQLRDGRLKLMERLGVRGMAEARGPLLLSPNASAAMRQSVIETMGALQPDGYRQAVWMLSQADTRTLLALVRDDIPVQVVFGDADTVTTPQSNRETATARPAAPIHVIAGAGHAVYIEKPGEFANMLRNFIQGPMPGKSKL